MSEGDILPTLVVLVLGTMAFNLQQKAFSPTEARLLGISFAAHVVSAFAQLWLVFAVYNGVADLNVYHRYGADLAFAMREDFWGVFPQVLLVVAQMDHRLSIYIPQPGTSVGTMVAATGLGNFLLGDSLAAVSLLFALGSYFGKSALYVATRESLPTRFHRSVLIGTMLVPSTVFWSSGIIKEGVAMMGLGPLVLGLRRLTMGRTSGLPWAAVGAVTIALVKPYILIAVAVATGAYVYWQRAARHGQVELRPVPLAIGVITAIGGLLVLGEIFPRFSIDRLAEETARLQAAGYSNKPGSNYVIGDPTSRTVIGQLAFAPLGLLTALYRPLIFEVHNAQAAINAIETSAFLGGTIWVWARTSVRGIWATLTRHPFLLYCLVFVAVLGVAVGLTSANLGTLSRYRIPLVPFLATLLLVIGAEERSTAQERPRSAGGLARPVG